MEKKPETHSYFSHKKEAEFNLERSSEANYQQFLFRNIVIYTQLLLIFLLSGFIIYDKTQERIYVTVEGIPYLAMVKNDRRSEAEIHVFLRQFLRYLLEFSRSTYVSYRNQLGYLASNKLIETIKYKDLNSVVTKTVLNTDVVKQNLSNFTVDNIEQIGSLFRIDFSAIRTIAMPESTFHQNIRQKAEMVTVERSVENPFGMKVISLINPQEE